MVEPLAGILELHLHEVGLRHILRQVAKPVGNWQHVRRVAAAAFCQKATGGIIQCKLIFHFYQLTGNN